MIFSTAKLVALLLHYKYIILLPIAILEGPMITIICGLLVSTHQLNLFIVYIIVILGDLIGDVVWYYIGYRYGRSFVKKYGSRFGITEKKIGKVEEKFHTYKNSILFFSKITNGLGFALVVLFTAGMSKIPFRRYMTINIAGQCIWSGILLTLGYFFGNILINTKSLEGKVFIVSSALVLLFIIIRYIRVLHKKLIS